MNQYFCIGGPFAGEEKPLTDHYRLRMIAGHPLLIHDEIGDLEIMLELLSGYSDACWADAGHLEQCECELLDSQAEFTVTFGECSTHGRN